MNGFAHFAIFISRDRMPIGGFPIEIETQISKLITHSLADFILNIKIAKLYVISLLILV